MTKLKWTGGPTETDSIESLRPDVIKLRDAALEVADFKTAVLLSHVIKWMSWLQENADAILAKIEGE